jgi:hypothetical protein
MVKINGTTESTQSYQRREEVRQVQTTTAQRNTEQAFSNSRRNDVQTELTRFRLQTAASQTSTPQTVAQQTPPADEVNMENVEHAFDRLGDAGDLAYQISDENTFLNEAEKAELLAVVVRSEDKAYILNTESGLVELPNVTYDAQQQIAAAMGEAYEQGVITDADLRGLAETLGNDDIDETASQRFVTVLAQDPNNLHAGGIVEAYGREAQSLGQDQAAAVAFSSSEELIRGNLTTTEARQEAFDQVQSFLKSEPLSYVPDGYGDSTALQSAYVQGLTNAARLHSWPGVATDEEFDALLQEAGPRYVQEAVARSSRIEGDDTYSSALNEFGDASRRLAESDGDDNRHDWNVNAALAYTQSETLINGNLTTREQRINAFDLLNHELAGQRDAAREAADHGYTLLRAPAMAEGLGQLLESHPEEILTAKLGVDGKNYEGQADLINLFESTLFSPYTSEETRNTIKSAVEDYIDTEFVNAGNNSPDTGNRLGSLLGVLDVSSQNAINAAEKPEERSFIDQASSDLAKTLLGAGAKALLKPTGPIGSLAGGFVVDQVLNKIFKNNPPSPEELGNAYIDLLESNDQDISLGSSLRDQYINLLTDTQTALNELRDNATGREFRDLDNASEEAGQLLDGIRHGYGEIVDAYQLDNGEINRALENWSDNYEEPERI